MFQTSEYAFDETVHFLVFERLFVACLKRYGKRHTLLALSYLFARVNIEKFNVLDASFARRTNYVLYLAASRFYVGYKG